MAGELAVPTGELARILMAEGRRRMVTLATVFAVIALAALLIAITIPKKYDSSTTILVQESNIVTGLMEGRAVATGVADRAGIAREVIFSRKVMNGILESGGWLAKNPTPVEQDRIAEDITNRTKITSPRDNLIQIEYSDKDPERSFHVTQRFAELFIQESLAAKERESREAYEFINSQVEDYHRKLAEAEENLKKYREENVDAHPGSEADTNSRISTLRSSLEQTRLNLMELRSTESALASQLSGESEVTAVQTRSGVYRAQLAELQGQLEKLLLTYTDQYPDVVRIRHQMEDIRKQLETEENRKKDPSQPMGLDQNVQFSPLYAELRSKLADTRRQIAAGESRMTATEALLNSELDRSRRVATSESALAELTRDYEVNRDVYQDLLKRRENARVSMNLDEEGRGLTFRIQEPAVMPVRPAGLRPMHLAIAGMTLALALPLGLLFGYARFDPRVRSAAMIESVAGVPLLVTIPSYPTPSDRRRKTMQRLIVVLLVLGVFATYAITYLFRLEAMR
jgi:polysaccharide chain length determinant protein (PEP-CTERM system associated)